VQRGTSALLFLGRRWGVLNVDPRNQDSARVTCKQLPRFVSDQYSEGVKIFFCCWPRAPLSLLTWKDSPTKFAHQVFAYYMGGPTAELKDGMGSVRPADFQFSSSYTVLPAWTCLSRYLVINERTCMGATAIPVLFDFHTVGQWLNSFLTRAGSLMKAHLGPRMRSHQACWRKAQRGSPLPPQE
jgi:hypothetical protein